MVSKGIVKESMRIGKTKIFMILQKFKGYSLWFLKRNWKRTHDLPHKFYPQMKHWVFSIYSHGLPQSLLKVELERLKTWMRPWVILFSQHQNHTHIFKMTYHYLYYKQDMTGKRQFAVGVDDFQYSFHSSYGLLYVKDFSRYPPPCFWAKSAEGGVIWS